MQIQGGHLIGRISFRVQQRGDDVAGLLFAFPVRAFAADQAYLKFVRNLMPMRIAGQVRVQLPVERVVDGPEHLHRQTRTRFAITASALTRNRQPPLFGPGLHTRYRSGARGVIDGHLTKKRPESQVIRVVGIAPGLTVSLQKPGIDLTNELLL